ncbi:MAG: hypothetical protein ABEI52_06590, partial [Halobacteriaceae archaeon]
ASPVEIDVIGNTSSQIPPNAWIAHQFGWQTEGDEGPAALQTVRSAVSSSFQLNGVEVTDFQQGWSEAEELPTGKHQQEWRYIVPPLPPGRHAYQLELGFENPVRTPGNPERVWDGTYRFEGTYSVTSAESSSTENNDRSRNARTGIHPDDLQIDIIEEGDFLNHGK